MDVEDKEEFSQRKPGDPSITAYMENPPQVKSPHPATRDRGDGLCVVGPLLLAWNGKIPQLPLGGFFLKDIYDACTMINS
ncbi:MAG: hypothetical protein LAO31_18295 [Acidobacteriia bacterium]|nr:hypothetical protein [Terriglobia bacterium]